MKLSVKIVGLGVLLVAFSAILACTGTQPSKGDTSPETPSTFTIVFNSEFPVTASNTVMPDQLREVITSPEKTLDALPTPPGMSGYTFGGWWEGRNGAGHQLTTTTEFTSETSGNYVIVFYAYWYKYKVTYMDGSTTHAIKTTGASGSTVGYLPAAPTKTGYTFDGWWTGSDGSGTQFTANTPITTDIIVYAKWIDNSSDVKVYMVTYNTDYSTTVAAQYVTSTEGNVGTLPPDPYAPFSLFGGWWTGQNGSGTQFISSTAVDKDIIVYAKWTAQSGYTVTYNTNGGTAVDPKYVIDPATTVGTLPSEPEKQCFAFVRWYSETEGVKTTFTDVTPVTSNITVYADWTWAYPSVQDPQASPPFQVGDRGPSCVGKVFYISDGGYSGLEAAPSNWVVTGDPYETWIAGTSETDEFGSIIDSTQRTLNARTSTAIGTGLANSNAIVAQTGHIASAAKLCLDYSVGEGAYVFDNWFLPSKDELAELYAHRDEKKSGGFSDYGYWSSSEYDTWNGWSQSFDDSTQNGTYKGTTRLVRPVRAFSFSH